VQGVFDAHQRGWQRDSLQRELAATREELEAMRALLDQLPEIFESRFASRMDPLLAERQRLVGETEHLRQHLLELQPSTPALMAQQPPQQPKLARLLRHAFGLPEAKAAAGWPPTDASAGPTRR
jgi:septal ring factor EnvC (AmiA/AmiB activator)